VDSAQELSVLLELSDPEGGIIVDAKTYLQYPFLSGGTLSRWCKDRPRSFAHKLNVLTLVMSSIAELHAKHVAHRNLSLDHVLLDSEEDGAVPRLIGFSRARDLQGAGSLLSKSPATNKAHWFTDDVLAFGKMAAVVLGSSKSSESPSIAAKKFASRSKLFGPRQQDVFQVLCKVLSQD
jgi:serine/threonine protein kinase